MFKRILVPLDGSGLSEQAIPAAAALAGLFDATLILMHVIEKRPPRTVHGERHLADAAEARSYLEELRNKLSALSLKIETHVHEESGLALDRGVSAHETELGHDLTVMVAHGARSLKKILRGSLPLRIAVAGRTAVLIIPASGHAGPGDGGFAIKDILLPLDGRAEHEGAIPAAIAFRDAFRVPLRLVGVVPRNGAESGGAGGTLARFSPSMTAAALEASVGETGRYLAAMAASFGPGANVSWSVVRGRPIRSIVTLASEAGRLLVMSTHRRLGLDASLDGCVASGVALALRSPTLIVPILRSDARN